MTLMGAAAVLVWLLGLCIGSFLNVVVYRLPLGLSVSQPRWSFCPACHAPIAWYDNLPVVGWLLLRGRCRRCRAAISVQYPLVEALTGLVFVQVFCLLFSFATRDGLENPRLPTDLALLAAWLALAAVMIACAAMDITAYVVDTRLTDTAIVVSLIAYALWPRPEFCQERVSGAAGAAATAAAIAGAAMLWFTVYRRPHSEPDPSAAPPSAAPSLPAPVAPRAFGASAIAVLAVVGLSLLTLAAPAVGESLRGLVIPLGLAAIFIATVRASGQQRAADDEIHEAIENEAPQARTMAAHDLLWLLPTIAAATAAALLVSWVPAADAGWRSLVGWRWGEFAPVAGVCFSLHGAIVAALAGWAVRLVFTLLLGREAFATGDIFILAAAGAAAGWDIALIGFLLAVPASLAGWLLSLLMKRSLMIPFGPWLAIGFLMALWLNRPVAAWADRVGQDLSLASQQRPEMLAMMAGVLVVGGGMALLLARWLRNRLETKG